MVEAAGHLPGAEDGATPAAPGPTADRERILLLECRLEQFRSALDEARADADRLRASLAESAAREAENARRYGLVHQELAEARAEIAALHERLGRSEALRAELQGHLFESGARGDAAELVRLRREVLAQRERSLNSERTLSRVRARMEELLLSRETLLTRVAEWQRIVRKEGPDAVDLAEFIAELRRDILHLEHRNAVGERQEAALRKRLVRAGVDPDAPAHENPPASRPDAPEDAAHPDEATQPEDSTQGEEAPQADVTAAAEADPEPAAEAEDGAPAEETMQPESGMDQPHTEGSGISVDPLQEVPAERGEEREGTAEPANEEPEPGSQEERAAAEAASTAAAETEDALPAPEPRSEEQEPPEHRIREAGTPEDEESTPGATVDEARPVAEEDEEPTDDAARSSGKSAPPEDAPDPALSAADPAERAAAYEKLTRVLAGDPSRLTDHLRTGLSDPDGRVRRRTVLAAAAVRHGSLRTLLDPLKGDPDPQVRRVVREVLRHAPPAGLPGQERGEKPTPPARVPPETIP